MLLCNQEHTSALSWNHLLSFILCLFLQICEGDFTEGDVASCGRWRIL